MRLSRALVLGVLATAMVAGCITPSIVQSGGCSTISLQEFPLGSVQVDVPVEADAVLRGVFVPAEHGAPVILHFLESGCSVSQGARAFPSHAYVWRLRDLGLASLILDYRGVGPSSGNRSPEYLPRDARAAFGEAIRRAGGDPARVALRGMSIGTLAAASLLHGGAQPAGVVLIAPVRSETIAQHFVRRTYVEPLGYLLAPFLRKAVDVDMLESVCLAQTPLLVAVAEKDPLLSDDERKLLRYSVRSAGGRWIVYSESDHMDLVLEAHHLLACEPEFYWEIFPGYPLVHERMARVLADLPVGARGRLEGDPSSLSRLESLVARYHMDPPRLAGALALSGPRPQSDEEDFIVAWLRSQPTAELETIPFYGLERLVDFSDPAGPLDPAELEAMERFVAHARVEGSASPEALVRRARTMGLAHRAVWNRRPPRMRAYAELYEGTRFALEKGDLPERAPVRLKLPERDSLRQAVRLLIKAAFLPDRVISENGVHRLEVFEATDWRSLDLDQ